LLGRAVVRYVAHLVQTIKHPVAHGTLSGPGDRREGCESSHRHECQSDKRSEDAEDEWWRTETAKRLAPEEDDDGHADAEEDKPEDSPDKSRARRDWHTTAQVLSQSLTIPVLTVSHMNSQPNSVSWHSVRLFAFLIKRRRPSEDPAILASETAFYAVVRNVNEGFLRNPGRVAAGREHRQQELWHECE
jgi:hypothetical protein